MRQFIVFINPISGTSSRRNLRERIAAKLDTAGFPYCFEETNAAGDYSGLPRRIQEEGITDMIICGGDGSVSYIASFIRSVDVNIGIIPLGSGNGLALACGIPTNVEKAMDIILRGNASLVDGMMVNERFSCMLTGLGFDAAVAHKFAAQKRRGLSKYAELSVKEFLSAEAASFRIETGSATFEQEAFFISIANSNQFGNNVTIAPQASLSDGKIDVVIATKMSKPGLIFSLLRQLKFGKPLKKNTQLQNSSGVIYFQTDKLRIHNRKLAPMHIDGDPAETFEHLDIRIVPKAFKLLQP